jgi:hypothetical protein
MLLKFWGPPGGASWWRDSEEDFSNRPHSTVVSWSAGQLRGRGLAPRLLFSSDYASLAPGFWITYVGPFPDRAAALREADRLTGLGFAGANAREIRC